MLRWFPTFQVATICFSCSPPDIFHNIQLRIQYSAYTGGNDTTPFAIDINTIRRRIRAIGKDKSVGPDHISGEIKKIGGGEAMIPYIARLLEITMNNGTLLGDWKRATVVPIHKGGDRSLVSNYRPVSLTSVVFKQMEHPIAT